MRRFFVFSRTRFIVLVIICIIALGIVVLAVLERAQQNRPVPVLMYHRIVQTAVDDVWAVELSKFERHLQFLRAQGYRSILPSDLRAATRGRRILPHKPVIITFDDGLASVASLAEPLLKRYGFRAVAYIITDYASPDSSVPKTYRNEPCLTQHELMAMDGRGVVRVGSHSQTHSRFPHVVAAEAAESHRLLCKWTGRKIVDFCYPYGVHPPGLVEAVRSAGFKTAMICADEVAVFHRHMDLYRIPRVSVYGGKHHFIIEPVEALPEEGDVLVWSARNEGTPIPFHPVLIARNQPFPLKNLPAKKLGPKPQRWRWPRAVLPDTNRSSMRVEIWDRHGILRLYP